MDTITYRSSAYYAEYLRFSVKIGVETDSYYRLIVEQILDFRKGDSTRTVTSFRSLGGYSWYYSGFSVDYEDPVFQSFGGSPITSQMDGRYCMGVFRGEDLVNTNAIKVSVFPVEYSYESDHPFYGRSLRCAPVVYLRGLLSIYEDYEGLLYHDRRCEFRGVDRACRYVFECGERLWDCRRISRG